METKLIFDSKIWDEALLAVTPDSSEATSAGFSGDDMSDSSSTIPFSCISAENYITVKEVRKQKHISDFFFFNMSF